MKIRKIAVYTAIATVLVLLAVPVNARFPNAYLAQIHAEGTLTLFGMTVGEVGEPPAVPDLALANAGEGIDLPVVVDFVATVPRIIQVGDYDAEFHGFAGVRDVIKFNGILKVELEGRSINFWVQFSCAKPEEISEGPYSANGMLEISISEDVPPPPEVAWVLMKGRVEKFNEADAFGSLIAHAKKGGDIEWTEVSGVFSLKPPPLPEEKLTPGTYSHDFYVVTLAEATNTELNNGEDDLYIEGNWNVHKRTVTITIVDSTEKTFTVKIEPVAEGKSGHLSATFEPSAFTLHIDDFGDITGEVVFFHAKHARPFEPGLPRGDFNRDRRVNIEDIVRMAKAYRAKLGEPGYDFDLDVNPDFEINILDLTVAAKEFGQEY
jgi:hypothetical protein